MSPSRQTSFRLLLTTFLAVVATAKHATSEEGDPVAIRYSDGCIVVESMWNLAVQIVISEQYRSVGTEGVDLIRSPGARDSLPNRVRQELPQGATLDFTLDRLANKTSVRWSPTGEAKPSKNAIRIQVEGPLVSVHVDGVRIVCLDAEVDQLKPQEKASLESADVLMVVRGEPSDAAAMTNAKVVVVGDDADEDADANTTVVNSKQIAKLQEQIIVRLNSKPLTLGADLEGLLVAKEVACRESQKVFADLTTSQMNFRPGNGSHTPRWNTEHMMGRELLFFSQIFNALDPMIPVMDLNPKQMPPDYQARHANWDGKEEARQMERVSGFTNRFAYLLKDLPLDEKAPGSRWTLRGLLRQMDRHYSEHTANVVKKFELPNWPTN
ncbi:MAG: DinB family protein [Rubripirellula sp.]